MVKENKSTQMGWALAITCFCSNMSQFPVFVNLGISSYIAIGVWVAFLGFLLFYRFKFKLENGVMPILIFVTIFATFLCVMQVFSNSNYLSSALIYPIFLSFFIMFLGTNVGKIINDKDFNNIISAYIYSTLIVSVYIFVVYLLNPYDASRVYSYDSKNSIAQIILTGCLLTVLFKLQNKNVIIKIIYLGVTVFFGTCLLLLKSRATLISIPFIVLFMLIFGNKGIKYFRLKLTGILVIGAVVLLLMPNVLETLLNDYIYGGRDSNDLNDLSSGRFAEWQNFFTDIGNGWIFGNGTMKRESLILTSIISFGFPMGIAVILFALTPLIFSIKRFKNRDGLITTLFYLAMIYFTNGIFEQLAPFGPGVKCYLLWLFFGIAIARQNMQENKSLGVLF